ncbi:ATP-binding protein [Mucilaginibacter mali]|uniref:ATP-binding protein n=1 Tax=Mucilaginibacter mali TaxID=2740462 RepID=A0A7D4UNY7_9SPHI|nr:ATP-binding protein [Mucilaginibacter mali]QKJ32441.1 ATP-binding protein [Mucilaginibacter mali]
MYELKPFTPIARTNWRNDNRLFGIKPKDRLHGMLVIGKSGMGKSQLLVNMALDDIVKGNGICVLDPHGQVSEMIKRRIPRERLKDVIDFDAANADALPAFNPLHGVPEHQRELVASEMVATFKKLFDDAWGSKMERTLRMSCLTLLQYPNSTLLDIHPLLTDSAFRAEVLQAVSDPHVLAFWNREFGLPAAGAQAAAILPILNKVGVLLSNRTLRGIFGRQGGISLERCMNEGKIVLCNLPKGVIGQDVAGVLGSFLISGIQNAAMRRVNVPAGELKPFYLFIDECHNFLSASFASMLPEVRKFGVGIFLAHQYLDQLAPDIRTSVLNSVGSIICFRIGFSDAKVMEKEFYPTFGYEDFVNLPLYHIYIKLLIDGSESKGFSAVTLPSFDSS